MNWVNSPSLGVTKSKRDAFLKSWCNEATSDWAYGIAKAVVLAQNLLANGSQLLYVDDVKPQFL